MFLIWYPRHLSKSVSTHFWIGLLCSLPKGERLPTVLQPFVLRILKHKANQPQIETLEHKHKPSCFPLTLLVAILSNRTERLRPWRNLYSLFFFVLARLDWFCMGDEMCQETFLFDWVNYEITQVWESQLEQNSCTYIWYIENYIMDYNGMMGSCCFVIHHIATKAIPGRKSPQRRESSDPISTTRITGLIARTWRSCFCRTLA